MCIFKRLSIGSLKLDVDDKLGVSPILYDILGVSRFCLFLLKKKRKKFEEEPKNRRGYITCA